MQKRFFRKRKKWEKSQQAKEYYAVRYIRAAFLATFIVLSLVGGIIYQWQMRPQPVDIQASTLRVSFIDVGQGDSILLQTADTVALVDGGDVDHGYTVLHQLKKLGITRIDYLINSHPHSDHLGGLATIIEEFDIGRIFMTEFPDALMPIGSAISRFMDAVEKKQLAIESPQCGDILFIGCASLEFLTVDHSNETDMNDCSLLCLVRNGNHSFLLCGDITKSAENAYIQAGLLSPITVLKCAHHGSNGSSSANFLEVTTPEYVVISVGADNSYGHPGNACLERIINHTREIYRTDMDGTIVFTSDGINLSIQTQEQSHERSAAT